jgi:CheY-like chemotaxis protein
MAKPILVLLIDDDDEDHLFFNLALQKIPRSIECASARNAEEALKMLGDNFYSPHFIFLDINMPGMNGIECLSEIKKIERLNDMKVYIYTTSSEENIDSICKQLGAEEIISKMSNIILLQEKLGRVFSKVKFGES